MAIILKPEHVAQLVFLIRGEKVMLDAHLAMLYGVEVRILNQAVARNRKRFPADFMFRLSAKEYENLRSQTVMSEEKSARTTYPLRSQFVISKHGRGGRRYLPYAFHRTGRCYAFQYSTQLSRGRSQHRNHANIRATSPSDGRQRRSRTQDREFGEEI